MLGGAANTALSYAVFLLLQQFMKPTAAYSAAYVLGIVFSYLINTTFVFRQRRSVRSALKFPFVYIAQYFVGLAILSILTYFGLDSRIAMLVVIAVSVPLTFVLSRFVLKRSS
ncbi:GtrA family protein [Microvirga yunnanensis]|uniref:GtrA family protein n=1 Tax=Microvirga yunnanensis TaxID=2953740 RepID=UPI0035A0584A